MRSFGRSPRPLVVVPLVRSVGVVSAAPTEGRAVTRRGSGSTGRTTVVLETVACAACGGHRARTARVRPPRDEYAFALGLRDGRSRWVVCDSCALVYQSPRPGPDAVANLYVGGSYHEERGGIPEHYLEYSLRRSTEALAWALSQPSMPLIGRALDIGCGVGGALVNLRNRGWEVVGVEPDHSLAEVGRQRFGLDVHDGFFDDGTFSAVTEFDLAYSCHVYEHLADPVATSRAAYRVLAPRRGHLVIVVPTFRRSRTLAWACFTAPHTYMFTDVSLGNVLDAAGFDVVAHRYAASGDSELWLVARARANESQRGVRKEDPVTIQRELTLAPLGAPLGLPARVRKHVRTLASDPSDFVARARRWASSQAARAGRAQPFRRP